MTEHHSCFGSVNKKSKKYRALTIYVHINCNVCFNEEEKINFKISWIPEADSKIFMQKRTVSENNLKKRLLKQPFFADM